MLKRIVVAMGIALTLTLLILAPGPEKVNAQSTFGTNWSATFYNTIDFTGQGWPASYPSGLNFNWSGLPTLSDNVTPVPGVVNTDNFSARFVSVQTFATTAEYRFFGTVDDRVTIYIDGVNVYSVTMPATIDFAYTLVAGSHTIQVDFVETVDVAIFQLQWQLSSLPQATAVPTSGPIGNVVTVSGLSLRTGPYLGASRIGVLVPANAYPVSGKSNDEGGWYTWYEVTAGEQVGWASGRYLTVMQEDQVPFKSTIFEQIDGAPDVGVTAIPRAYMHFRVRPSVRSAINPVIDQIPWGAETQLVGRTVQDGRNHWFQVRYEGQIGWIYAPYVSVRGNLNSVPIR